jgi:DNA-directed RNA polymerase specialized sigma24 family protein
LEWLESAQDKPVEDVDSDAIHNELLSGAVWRELARARDDLARARVRYAEAVRQARAVGFSWGEIGRVLAVPRQSLHRRFRHDVD